MTQSSLRHSMFHDVLFPFTGEQEQKTLHL